MSWKRLATFVLCGAVLCMSAVAIPVAAQDASEDTQESALRRTWSSAEEFLWGFVGNVVEPFRIEQLEKTQTEEARIREMIENEKPPKDAPSLDKVVHLLRIIWRAVLFFLVLILASKTLFLLVSVVIVFIVVRKIVRWIRYRVRGYE